MQVYDLWLEGLPYVNSGTAGIEAYAHRLLIRDAWPAVEQLCIRLEALGKSELARRIERAFRDVEDYARLIDDYCESDKFDFDLWQYGDPVKSQIAEVKGDVASLIDQASVEGRLEDGEDFGHWSDGRDWTVDLGQRSAQKEVEKYGHPPTRDYVQQVAHWLWSCFWLAAQLYYRDVDHRETRRVLESYLSSMGVVTETKYPVIREALGRAYGMDIYPIAPMESEEVRRALDGLAAVVVETQTALLVADTQAVSPSAESPAGGQEQPRPSDATPVTLVEFMQKYCQGGKNMTRGILDSRKTSLQNAAQNGAISLPDYVGQWKRGKPNYYHIADLAERWSDYRKELPNLPPLKAGGPCSGQGTELPRATA